MEGVFRVIVMGFKGERLTVGLGETKEQFMELTVLDLKIKLLQQLPSKTDPERLVLIFADEILDDSKLLCEYGIQHLSVIQFVLTVSGGGGGPEKKEDQKNSPPKSDTASLRDQVGASGNLGERDGRNMSMDRLKEFNKSCVLSRKQWDTMQ